MARPLEQNSNYSGMDVPNLITTLQVHVRRTNIMRLVIDGQSHLRQTIAAVSFKKTGVKENLSETSRNE